VLVPLGFVLLAAYSLGIEETQLHVARIDRACDVTDILDNVTGAALGVLLAVLLLPLLRPWRGRGRREPEIG
jgi:glycopeptide antibiotics resistance protein